jgi:hypothetical protein
MVGFVLGSRSRIEEQVQEIEDRIERLRAESARLLESKQKLDSERAAIEQAIGHSRDRIAAGDHRSATWDRLPEDQRRDILEAVALNRQDRVSDSESYHAYLQVCYQSLIDMVVRANAPTGTTNRGEVRGSGRTP